MFRFTIRDLVLLTLVVAMGVGWWIDHSEAANARDSAIRQRDAAMADARKLAYYWGFFLQPLTDADMVPFFKQDTSRYWLWTQFQKVRDRYNTLERPSLIDE